MMFLERIQSLLSIVVRDLSQRPDAGRAVLERLARRWEPESMQSELGAELSGSYRELGEMLAKATSSASESARLARSVSGRGCDVVFSWAESVATESDLQLTELFAHVGQSCAA